MTEPAVCASHVCFSPCHFTGKERDTESGNDYFGARYLTSSMGRWLSPDPLGMAFADPADPQSLNHYAYVMNNPLIFSDPDGLDCMYTSNQNWNSITVTIHRGNDKYKKGGTFVDGTIDAKSLHYYVDQGSGDSSLGYNASKENDPKYAAAGVMSLGKVNPPDTDGQLAPSIKNQFSPQLATTSFNFNRALPVPCGVGTNFGANFGPARLGWDVNTSKGLRFSANLRAAQVGPLGANLSLSGRSASLNISDTPFALTAGLSGNRVTSLGMSVGMGPDGITTGFSSARAGAYVLTGNFQDGCRAW